MDPAAARPANILVVDDDQRNLRLIKAILAPSNHKVILASSGEEAMAALRGGDVDIAILDIMMPGMDGVKVCRRLRTELGLVDIPVIFLTALGDRENRIKAKAAGGDDFLTKPFEEEELLARVGMLLEVKAFRDLRRNGAAKLEMEVAKRTGELADTVARIRLAKEAIRQTREEVIQRLCRAAEFRDDHSGRHVERMSRVCALLGEEMGLDQDGGQALQLASAMHDVGKIGTPDRILFKLGPLTKAEFLVAKEHTRIGHNLLSGNEAGELLNLAATIALTHHERVDGSGYPQGLAGSVIPLSGRIAAVSDVFDTVTSDRSYRQGVSAEEGLQIVEKGNGTQFDPEVVAAFVGLFDEVLAIGRRFPDMPTSRDR